MYWTFVHKAWEKWTSRYLGSSGQPVKAALLINYDPTGPSRLLSTIAKQDGICATPIDLSELVDFVKREKPYDETFTIGPNQYMVTSVHENWFSARCVNTSKSAGEGAIVVQTVGYLLVAMYDGSLVSASRAMMAVDQFAWQLNCKNL